MLLASAGIRAIRAHVRGARGKRAVCPWGWPPEINPSCRRCLARRGTWSTWSARERGRGLACSGHSQEPVAGPGAAPRKACVQQGRNSVRPAKKGVSLSRATVGNTSVLAGRGRRYAFVRRAASRSIGEPMRSAGLFSSRSAAAAAWNRSEREVLKANAKRGAARDSGLAEWPTPPFARCLCWTTCRRVPKGATVAEVWEVAC